nr:immunoglobulin heavy chain junction region [Mus musculus]
CARSGWLLWFAYW